MESSEFEKREQVMVTHLRLIIYHLCAACQIKLLQVYFQTQDLPNMKQNCCSLYANFWWTISVHCNLITENQFRTIWIPLGCANWNTNKF